MIICDYCFYVFDVIINDNFYVGSSFFNCIICKVSGYSIYFYQVYNLVIKVRN